MTRKEDIISCVCLTCGVRNDHSTDNGYCQNGHDDWLEWMDVRMQNETYLEAVERSGMHPLNFQVAFMDNDIKQFQFKPKTTPETEVMTSAFACMDKIEAIQELLENRSTPNMEMKDVLWVLGSLTEIEGLIKTAQSKNQKQNTNN